MATNGSIESAIEVLETITHVTEQSSGPERAQAILEIRFAIQELGSALKELALEGNMYFESYLQAEFEGSERGWLGKFLVDQLRELAKTVDGDAE